MKFEFCFWVMRTNETGGRKRERRHLERKFFREGLQKVKVFSVFFSAKIPSANLINFAKC